MTRHMYLKRRGGTWGIRRRVPKDIVEVLGKKELWRTLRTEDKTTAQTRYPVALQSMEQEFAMVRAQISAGAPVSLSGLDVEWEAQKWFEREVRSLKERDIQQFDSQEERLEYVRNLGTELSEWKSGEFPRYAQNLQSCTDRILITPVFQIMLTV